MIDPTSSDATTQRLRYTHGRVSTNVLGTERPQAIGSRILRVLWHENPNDDAGIRRHQGFAKSETMRAQISHLQALEAEVAASRITKDPKDLYQRARTGEITGSTEVDEPYKAPVAPELVLDTENDDVDTLAVRIVELLAAG